MQGKFGIKQIMPLAVAALCVVFLYTGLTKFGFWDATSGPTPAFVPTIISVVLFIICILGFITSFKDKKESKFHKEEFLVIGAAILIIAATFLIGLLPSLAVFLVLWLKLVEKTPWKTTIIILLFLMALVIGVFVLWLGVPFPEGLIMDLIG